MPFASMKDLFKMLNYRQHAKYSLDHPSVVALSALAAYPVLIIAPFMTKALIRQHRGFVRPPQANVPKILVVYLGAIPAPIDYLADRCHQPAHFHADKKTMLSFPLFADLRRAASFPYRMDQFHPIAI